MAPHLAWVRIRLASQALAPPPLGLTEERNCTRACSSPAPPSALPKLTASAAIPAMTTTVYRSMLDRSSGLTPFICSARSRSKNDVPAETDVALPPNLRSSRAAQADRTHPSTGHPIR